MKLRIVLPDMVFPSMALPSSRVGLTLNANLLPGKVVFPEKREMRPVRQQTG
jgi:hypothetical protein